VIVAHDPAHRELLVAEAPITGIGFTVTCIEVFPLQPEEVPLTV
jgi:hypothetical protein